jgi:type VI secretion system secreted protein VgrG
MRVDTTLGGDVLLLAGFAGEESVSEPFAYTLDLLSEDSTIAAEDLLRTPATITVKVPGGDDRIIHGLVSRFTQLGQTDELTSYRAELVPWLWFLSLSADCKIFQNKDVLEIVEQVFKDQKYSDFAVRCTKSYPKREYCVQYRESHLNFVSRLLEEEGIFYFFEHSSEKHVLVLADNNSSVKPCPSQASARVTAEGLTEEDIVTAFQRELAVHVGTVTLNDYDSLQPSLNLKTSVAGDEKEEVYDYPGMYTEPEEGERLARLQLEAHETLREVVRGQSTCRGFQSGYRFDLKGHYRRDLNKSYMLLEIMQSGRGGSYQNGDSEACDYSNDFARAGESPVLLGPGRQERRE